VGETVGVPSANVAVGEEVGVDVAGNVTVAFGWVGVAVGEPLPLSLPQAAARAAKTARLRTRELRNHWVLGLVIDVLPPRSVLFNL